MAIPSFVNGFLPPGPHPCTWDELQTRFCGNQRRQDLSIVLQGYVQTARDCGFAGIAVGGGFVSDKLNPGDLDLLFIIPRNYDRENLQAKCAELLVNDQAFKRRTGHNGLNCSDDEEVVQALIHGLGYDLKTNRDRGMLLMRFV